MMHPEQGWFKETMHSDISSPMKPTLNSKREYKINKKEVQIVQKPLLLSIRENN